MNTSFNDVIWVSLLGAAVPRLSRGAWCDILPSFVGSMAVSALLRAVLGKARLTLEQWLGRRDGEKETRGWGAKDILPAFQGPMESRACAGV